MAGFQKFSLSGLTVACSFMLALGPTGCSTLGGSARVAFERSAPSAVTNGSTKEGAVDDAKKSKLPASGDVLVAGGASGTKSSKKAEFYDPTTQKWTSAGSMTIDRLAPCGLILVSTSAKVLVAGGAQETAKTKNELTLTLTPLNTAEEYDQTTGAFTATSNSLTTQRMGCTATQLLDGTVLIAGGLDSAGAPLTSAEIFDPTAGTFTATTGSMASPRAFHTATLIPTGTLAGEVLITGGLANNAVGSGEQGLTLDTAELYNPSTGTFTTVTSPMTDFRAFHTATLLQDGTVLVAGGVSNPFPGFAFGGTTRADIFDPSTQTFSGTAGPLTEFLVLQSATLLPDGTVLLAGGFDADQIDIFTNGSIGAFFGTVAQGAEIYSPTTKTFSCIGGTTTAPSTGLTVCASTMKRPHAGHAAVLLNDGTVLIAGGYGGSKPSKEAKPNKIAEIYDPTTQTFTKVGSMKTALAQGVAVLLQTFVSSPR